MSTSKKSRTVQWIVAGFILLIVLLTVFVYSLNNSFTRSVARVIPYPAAFVGIREVPVGNYYFMLDLTRTAAKTNLGAQDKSAVLDKAIENKVIFAEAVKRGVSVSNADIDKYYSYLQTLTGSQQLGKNYGLSEKQFKDLVIVPDIFSIKLQQKLSQDKTVNADAYSKLDKVKSALSSGISLETSAQQYSDDKGSGRIGGDIGFVSSADIAPEFYDDISSTQDENVHIFVSRYGIHVYKIYGKDHLGPNGGERYHIKQVFIRTQDFGAWLQKIKQNYRIIKVLK